MKKLSLLLLVTIGLVLSQCKKEAPHKWNDVPPNPVSGNSTPYTINKGTAVKLDAIGRVTNEMGLPMEGVQIVLEGKTYKTNSKGLVQIAQGDAYKNIAYIQAKMDGYFPGSRTFTPQEGINRFEIMLISKGIAQTFSANTGSTLQEGDAEVQLGAGFVDASGQPYTGTVRAYVKHLNPDDPNIDKIMPGDLRGANDDGERLLETYGMIAVELESESGQKLEMAEGNPATIKLKVPASILNRAPATIPLWHFEEGKGIWGQEGEAKLINGAYVGEVSHFSLWNCDRPYDLTKLDAQINIGQEYSCAFDVRIIRPNGESRSVKSTELGNFGGLIPANEDLKFEFKLDDEVVDVISLKSSSNETMTHEFRVTIPDPVKISGTVKGCLGTDMTTGTILVNDWFLFPIRDGKYSFEFKYKQGKEISIQAFYISGEYSPVQTKKIMNLEEVIPEITLCSNNTNDDDLNIRFKMNGKDYTIEGLKKIHETDSIFSFRGGKAAGDFGTSMEFSLSFYKDRDWSSMNQIEIKPLKNNGFGVFDIGDGVRHMVQDLSVVVINRNPYQVIFSGTYIYYDEASQSVKTRTITDGMITEK